MSGGLTAQAARLLGGELANFEPLHGGSLNQVIRVALADGSTAIAKSGDTAQIEAEMLTAIARTGAPAPRVLATAPDLLVLEDLGPDDDLSRAWADLGRTVRTLHNATGETYGWRADHRFGSVEIPNVPLTPWPAFWSDRRLRPSLPHIPRDLAQRVEALCPRLDTLLPADPRAALLHGDLWTGNVMAHGTRITGLIDPACYYGHAEADLAMLSLFATPSPAFWQTYGDPGPEWPTRRAIYQLWPALVHLRLFGTGYRGLVERLLSELKA